MCGSLWSLKYVGYSYSLYLSAMGCNTSFCDFLVRLERYMSYSNLIGICLNCNNCILHLILQSNHVLDFSFTLPDRSGPLCGFAIRAKLRALATTNTDSLHCYWNPDVNSLLNKRTRIHYCSTINNTALAYRTFTIN